MKNIKKHLAEYLSIKGITPDQYGKINCLCHDDHDPSMQVNEDFLYCYTCGESLDIYSAAAALLDVPCDGEHFSQIVRDVEPITRHPPNGRSHGAGNAK